MNTFRMECLEKAVDMLHDKKFENVYFTACGGSFARFLPIQYMVESNCNLPAYVYNANEFTARRPNSFNQDSLLITCSHSGETNETLEAARYGKKVGATVVGFSNNIDSSLSKLVDYPIVYDWGFEDEVNVINSNNGVLFRYGAAIIDSCKKSSSLYEKMNAAAGALQTIVVSERKEYVARAYEFGKKVRRKDNIYPIASGINYGPAYAMSMCLFMEMLWIHSNPIHSGEYFHGPFEITDEDIPFFLVKGIGRERTMDDRVNLFLQKHANIYEVLDMQSFCFNGIDEEIKPYVSVILEDQLIRVYANAIADLRGHPLSVRRYMWREEY